MSVDFTVDVLSEEENPAEQLTSLSSLTQSYSYYDLSDVVNQKRICKLIKVDLKSWVWKDVFRKYPKTIDGCDIMGVCKICWEKFKDDPKSTVELWEFKLHQGSTSKMSRHIKNCHKEYYDANVRENYEASKGQITVDQLLPLKGFTRNEIIQESLLKFVVLEDLPLQIVERTSFRNFINHLSPNYPHEDRQSLNDRMNQRATVCAPYLKYLLTIHRCCV